MKRLLEHLSFCNKHIKYYKRKNGVISNTKFYNLKTCVLNSLISFPMYYDISIKKCEICEDIQGNKLVSLTICYEDKEYSFHQPLENVVHSLMKWENIYGNPINWPKTEYVKETNIPKENWRRFEEGIGYIKYWVWENYNLTLANHNLFINKPCQYLNLLTYIKPNIIIKINRDGVFTNNYNGSQIGYNANVQLFDDKWKVKCGSLKEIRKQLKLLLYVNESKRNIE